MKRPPATAATTTSCQRFEAKQALSLVKQQIEEGGDVSLELPLFCRRALKLGCHFSFFFFHFFGDNSAYTVSEC